MANNIRILNISGYSPIVQMIVALAIILGLGLFLMILMLIPGFLFFHVDLTAISSSQADMASDNPDFLRYMVIVQDIAIFIIPAIIVMLMMRPVNQEGLPDLRAPFLKDVALVVLLAFALIPVTDFTGLLNSRIHLPEWLSGIESWMVRKENEADNMIDNLIVSSNIRQMFLNLFIIALLPAIGEELVFRGVFQKILYGLFRSGHAAVWFTAVVFSAVHFQFLGFIPRLILGLVFGYLFLWSRTLWLPMAAHFVNNAIPVAGTYLHMYDTSLPAPALPHGSQLTSLLLPVVVCVMILYYFRNKFQKEQPEARRENND